MHNLIKRYPVTSLFVVLIFVACMIPIPQTPLSGVSLIDKWTHIAMFFALEIMFWTEKNRSRSNIKGLRLFVVSILCPAFMGGLIEIMQEYLTTCRSGDPIDFFADCIGVVVGAIAGRCVISPLFAKARKQG